MKNLREYYLGCLEAEKPKFVRVLKAVPGDQAAYRPHPRCKCAGDLVWLLASELQDACEVVERGTVSFVARPAPPVAEFATALRAVGEPMRGLAVKDMSIGMMLDGLFNITRDFDMQTEKCS